MKRLVLALALCLGISPAIFAHEGNDHVRGTVTEITANAITVQTTPTATKTLTLDDKTVFKKSGGLAHVADLKVGDRVVIDVPAKTTLARLVQFGAPKKP